MTRPSDPADRAPPPASGFFRVLPDGRLVAVEDARPAPPDDLADVFGARPSVVPPDWTTKRAAWTVSEIAGELKVGASTVRGWCDDGTLVAAKTSERGHYRVQGDDLRRFLNGRPDPIDDPLAEPPPGLRVA